MFITRMYTCLLTLYWLIAHFQIAPVAAASSFLLSWRERSETSVSRPPQSYTAFLVCSSTAHCQVKIKIKQRCILTVLLSFNYQALPLQILLKGSFSAPVVSSYCKYDYTCFFSCCVFICN